MPKEFQESDAPREYINEIVDPTSPMFSVPCGLYTVSVKKQRQPTK